MKDKKNFFSERSLMLARGTKVTEEWLSDSRIFKILFNPDRTRNWSSD